MSTPGVFSTFGVHEYIRGVHEYIGGCSVHQRATMSTLEDIMITFWGVL